MMGCPLLALSEPEAAMLWTDAPKPTLSTADLQIPAVTDGAGNEGLRTPRAGCNRCCVRVGASPERH